MQKAPRFLIMLSALSLILASGCPSLAVERCSRLLELTDLDARSPKLSEFLASPAYDRLLRTQPKSLRELSYGIITAPIGLTRIAIQEKNFSAVLYVKKSAGAIAVEIAYVTFDTPEEGPLRWGKEFWNLGNPNPSLNMLFPRVIAAVAFGLNLLVASDPDLRTISISGSKVVNLSLTKQLRELGFEPSRSSTLRLLHNGLHREGLYVFWMYNLASWAGLTDTLPNTVWKSIKLAKNSVLALTAFRYRDLGRTWTIEFQVQHDPEP